MPNELKELLDPQDELKELLDPQVFEKELNAEEIRKLFEKGPLVRVSVWERIGKDDEP